MADPTPITYHFEEDASPDELRNKSEDLFRAGWRKVGAPRQIEMKFPDGRRRLHFSQTFARTARSPPPADCVWSCLDARCRGLHNVYRGEISPGEHVLQVYGEPAAFVESLENFIASGLADQQAVIVIATPAHRRELEGRLARRDFNLATLRAADAYIDLDAEETLDGFMRDGRPDEKSFRRVMSEALVRARRGGRAVRACGEMVSLLWARGDIEATVLLERYWHVYCQVEDLPLFCAYPWKSFRPAHSEILREIYGSHTRLVG